MGTTWSRWSFCTQTLASPLPPARGSPVWNMVTVNTLGAITFGAALADGFQRRPRGGAMLVANTTMRTPTVPNHQARRRWVNEVIGIRVSTSNLHHVVFLT